MVGHFRPAKTGHATTGRAARKAWRWSGMSTAKDYAMTPRRNHGTQRILRAVPTVVAAKTISGAPEATACSTVLPSSNRHSGEGRETGRGPNGEFARRAPPIRLLPFRRPSRPPQLCGACHRYCPPHVLRRGGHVDMRDPVGRQSIDDGVDQRWRAADRTGFTSTLHP
jgi:hypothetical protein